MRTCGGAERCSACRFAETARRVQDDLRRAANSLQRKFWLADEEFLELFHAEHGRPPTGKEWPMPVVVPGASPSYHFVRRVAESLGTGIASQLARQVEAKWNEIRWKALGEGEKSPPFYKRGLPIPVRAQDFSRRMDLDDDGRFVLGFSLEQGIHRDPTVATRKAMQQFRFRLLPRDKYQTALFARLVQPNVKIGKMELKEDRKGRRKNRWFARIAYTVQVPRATGKVVAAINRGIRTFLQGVFSDGDGFYYLAEDIEAHLKSVQARRRKFQSAARFCAHGHGRKRLLRRIERLQAAGEHYRIQRCQRIVREVMRHLLGKGVGILYLEDLSGTDRADRRQRMQGCGALIDEGEGHGLPLPHRCGALIDEGEGHGARRRTGSPAGPRAIESRPAFAGEEARSGD